MGSFDMKRFVAHNEYQAINGYWMVSNEAEVCFGVVHANLS